MKFKKLIPTFIPFAYELIHIYKRNAKHDQNIRKKDRQLKKLVPGTFNGSSGKRFSKTGSIHQKL